MNEVEASILQISCGGLGNGGVQKIIMDIKKNIKCKKSDIVLFTSEKRFYDDEFESLNGHIYRIPIKKRNILLTPVFKYLNLFLIYFKICNILKNNKYDIIHCHNEFEAGVCLKAAKKYNVKVRISHHHRNDYNENKKMNIILLVYKRILKKMIIKYSTNIICCSKDTKNSLFGNIETNKCVIIYNSIDTNYYLKQKRIKTNGLILTNVGAYCNNKNQLFLIEIAKFLKEIKFDYKLFLIGYGNYKKILINKIKEYNLKNVYLIDGIKNDKIKYLNKTDIFLFPSKKEGFGISLIEAQAMGIYCIASSSITNETNLGLVEYIDINNDKLWIEKIISFDKNKKRKINYSIMKQFDVSNFCKMLIKIYGGLNENKTINN